VRKSGFRIALEHIDRQHGKDFATDLLELEAHTSIVEIPLNQSLYDCNGGPVSDRNRGFFFIEKGIMKLERDASLTTTRGGSGLGLNLLDGGSLNRMRARRGTLGRQLQIMKETGHRPQHHSIRIARIGPGWVVGATEGLSGNHLFGIETAMTECRLHRLPFTKMSELEETNPRLILKLYKLLSHLTARRNEITVGQLATLHSIMSSPAHTRKATRTCSFAINFAHR